MRIDNSFRVIDLPFFKKICYIFLSTASACVYEVNGNWSACANNVTNNTLCLNRHGLVRQDDQQTICQCSSYDNITCKTYPYKVCLDENNVVHTQSSSWFISDCVNCTCNHGNTTCTQHDIQSSYGRYVVKSKTCYMDKNPKCLMVTSYACKGILTSTTLHSQTQTLGSTLLGNREESVLENDNSFYNYRLFM